MLNMLGDGWNILARSEQYQRIPVSTGEQVMGSNMAKLTIALVDRLWKEGLPGRRGDSDCRGLYFKITGPKAGSWVLRYQLDGCRSEMGLGPYPTIGLAEARETARGQRKLARVDRIDPLARRQAERSKLRAQTAKQCTVRQLIEEYAKIKKPGWGHWMVYCFGQQMKKHVLPVIGDVLVRDINVALVRQVVDPIWTAKPTLAREIQATLARLFEYAEFYELRTGNPARGIQKYLPKQAEGGHRKTLPYEQMPAFVARLREYQAARPWYRGTADREALRAARAEGKSVAQISREFGIKSGTAWWRCMTKASLDYRKLRAYALEFLILTGPPRTGEILSILWQDIDLERKVLIMPRSRMKVKKGDDHIIPLTTRALEIIKELKNARQGDYLFPGSTQGRRLEDQSALTTRPPPVGVVGLPMSRASLISFLRNDIGRSDFDVHGIRKSFTNWAYASGRFRDIAIELSLDHAYGNKIHRAYRDDQLVEERRELLQAWQNYCDGSSADVISLPTRESKVSAG
jgi:integrase